jgi:predicted Zn-dependent protease
MAKRNRSRSTRYNLRSFSNSERQSTMRRMISYLRSLANRRSSGVVTADDAHTFLTREGVNVGQIRTRLSFINSVFSGEMFEYAGTTRSSRPAARGRSISTYSVA